MDEHPLVSSARIPPPPPETPTKLAQRSRRASLPASISELESQVKAKRDAFGKLIAANEEQLHLRRQISRGRVRPDVRPNLTVPFRLLTRSRF